jgi:MFS family permease
MAVLFVRVFCGSFAFPICAILITQSSPSRELLGTVNGANQALGSLCRAIGPSIAGFMYTRSLELSRPWIVWRYGLGIFAVIVWIGGWFLRDENCLPRPADYTAVAQGDVDELLEEFTLEASEANKVSTPSEEQDSDDEFIQGVSSHLLSREH